MSAKTVRSAERKAGQSIVETVVGIIFLIPIVLFLLDIAVLVMANTANDNLAKAACRAAASARDASSNVGTANAGYSAAVDASKTMAASDIINKPDGGQSFLTGYCWNGMGAQDTQGSSWPDVPKPAVGNVGVVTGMTVKVPVPFPFLPSEIHFQARAVEPVVSIPAAADQYATTAAAAAASANNGSGVGSSGVNNYSSGNGSSGNGYGDNSGAGSSSSDGF